MSTSSLIFCILFPLPFSKTLFLQVSLFILYWQFFSIWSLSSVYKLVFPILKKTLISTKQIKNKNKKTSLTPTIFSSYEPIYFTSQKSTPEEFSIINVTSSLPIHFSTNRLLYENCSCQWLPCSQVQETSSYSRIWHRWLCFPSRNLLPLVSKLLLSLGFLLVFSLLDWPFLLVFAGSSSSI